MSTEKYSDYVAKAAEKYGVDQSLIYAVIQQESGGNPAAVSSAGAVGLMQLMPGTAKQYGVSDRTDPEQNIMGGTAYLSDMLDRYNGDTESALAAYYAGAGNVSRFGKEKYSWYYSEVLSRTGATGTFDADTDLSQVQPTGSSTDLKWWGNIVLVVLILLCVLLGVVCLYLAVNDGIPGVGSIVKGMVK